MHIIYYCLDLHILILIFTYPIYEYNEKILSKIMSNKIGFTIKYINAFP